MTTAAPALGPTRERGGPNRAWNLKSFMDSLIVELDRAQDVLSVKGLTRPVTYTVRDVEVDLRCFPEYDGRTVQFLTARPGEDGASALKFSLGSISAGAIRESAPEPPEADDVGVDTLDGLDPDAKSALATVGVRTGRDLQRVADRGVDLRAATDGRAPDYSDLAALITKAHRRRLPPRVRATQLSTQGRSVVLHLDGTNLVVSRAAGYPYALLDGRRVPVRHAAPDRVTLDAAGYRPGRGTSRLTVALDPLTLITAELTL